MLPGNVLSGQDVTYEMYGRRFVAYSVTAGPGGVRSVRFPQEPAPTRAPRPVLTWVQLPRKAVPGQQMTIEMYWQTFTVLVPASARGGEVLEVVLPKKVAEAMAKEEAENRAHRRIALAYGRFGSGERGASKAHDEASDNTSCLGIIKGSSEGSKI